MEYGRNDALGIRRGDRMDQKKLWEKCVAFHGHECGGLTIGFKAALYAIELLKLSADETQDQDRCISTDEEVVCIAENDACGVDAIQVLLGCSIGKGNLLFHMRGKQAFSFYSRKTGSSVRLVLKPQDTAMTREQSFAYYQKCEPSQMFDVKETTIRIPEKARIFRSLTCSRCGERAAENHMRMQGEELLCLDCYEEYNRFSV